jgi:site-specific DNA-methyltransferase (adenine-specific)
MARKPLAEKTVAENCLKYGTGGINIDESRVGIDGGETHTGGFRGNNGIYGTSKEVKTDKTPQGRFPANLIHDNSEEVRECFPETKSKGHNPAMGKANPFGGDNNNPQEESYFTDSGNASRFFKSIIYTAKASKSERNMGCEGLEEKIQNNTETNSRTFNDRCLTCKKKFVGSDNTICHCPPELKITDKTIYTNKNNHPTVKPVALMEYLIKMVTPKGGIVLDPFMGSGTTGIACRKLNYGFIGIELEEDYITIAKARINSIKAVQEKLL